VAFSPDGTRVASASGDYQQENTVMVNAVTGGGATQLYKGRLPMFALVWSPDGKRIASGGGDATIQVWDVTTGSVLFTRRKLVDNSISSTYNAVLALAWSPDGKRVASGGQDTTVQIWDADNGNTLFIYAKHSLFVNSVAWEPSGTRIASACSDFRVEVWQA
jgi:WD40 repeat protein